MDYLAAVIQVLSTSALVIVALWHKLSTLDKSQGVMAEKVSQLESRLKGNGSSVPGRCDVAESRLRALEGQAISRDDLSERVRELELNCDPRGD